MIDRYRSEGNGEYWLQDMKIIPVNFNSEHKDMLANCKMVLEEDGGHIAVNPMFNKLITSLRTAVDIDGKLERVNIIQRHI